MARNLMFLSVSWAICLSFASPAFPQSQEAMLDVTPSVVEYATKTVKPALDACEKRDVLSLLLKVSEVLHDPEKGISLNKIPPSDYFVYHFLDKVKLGFLLTWKFSSDQKMMLERWHDKYMQNHPADVFFAPSSDEIIKTRAAFGCTHHARAFIAVVKALGLVEKPEDLRYVVSSKADDYNRALEKNDADMTINGHQFVLARVGQRWVAINTSKSESSMMPEGFSPESCTPPRNIAVTFASYPADVVFLLRKVGKDYNDDCGDDSLSHLMNISRSGDTENAAFQWVRFVATDRVSSPVARAAFHKAVGEGVTPGR